MKLSKFYINPKYARLRLALAKIPSIFDTQGQEIYHSRNVIKVFHVDGIALNVKSYGHPNWINKFVYSSGLRKPKGLRAYQYPSVLRKKGIGTPEEVAYIEYRHWHILKRSFFISVQSPYPHTFYEAGNFEAHQHDDLAEAFAKFTARMHEQGVMHRDYSPGNILWDQQGGEYHFLIVDINRLYFGPVSLRKGCRNFARLWGPKSFFITIVRTYARCRHFDEELALRVALCERKRFWKRISRKHPVKFKLEY